MFSSLRIRLKPGAQNPGYQFLTAHYEGHEKHRSCDRTILFKDKSKERATDDRFCYAFDAKKGKGKEFTFYKITKVVSRDFMRAVEVRVKQEKPHLAGTHLDFRTVGVYELVDTGEALGQVANDALHAIDLSRQDIEGKAVIVGNYILSASNLLLRER